MVVKYREPTAQLISCEVTNHETKTKVKFDRLPSPPLAPSSFGNISDTNGTFIRLHKVIQREGNIVTFVSYESQACLLQIGEKYSFRPYWSPRQLRIAQSTPERWRKTTFKASNMLVITNKDGSIMGKKMAEGEAIGSASVVSNGWAHEHCSLCWKNISESEHEEPFGYVSNYDWICQECYRKYIKSGVGKKLSDLD
jgi:hypothetical protein